MYTREEEVSNPGQGPTGQVTSDKELGISDPKQLDPNVKKAWQDRVNNPNSNETQAVQKDIDAVNDNNAFKNLFKILGSTGTQALTNQKPEEDSGPRGATGQVNTADEL